MTTEFSSYYNKDAVRAAVEAGQHRQFVGGLWDEIGNLQFEFLKARGLRSDHLLLDVGCGALRGGVPMVRYLEPGHYYGLDLNEDLLQAGYERELTPLGLHTRLPREHLISDSQFEFSRFQIQFDRAIAVSVFTHLPLDLIRVCLEKLAGSMRPGGVFYATFFEANEGQPTHRDITHVPGSVVTHGGSDPFHHRMSDFLHLVAGLPWDLDYIGDFGHPRSQKMLSFTRRAHHAGPQPEVRSLAAHDALLLPPGADHYRAYVGPPERYDFIGASQFALLFQLGLRDRHKVLDFGCGSLRLGRLLIPFLRESGYHGIDPNRWLIEDGLDHELGRGALALKKPRFAYNEDFNCDVFEQKFDFIIAQSIITHTGPDLLARFIRSSARALSETGVVVFSYIRELGATSLPADGWHYPECVGFDDSWLNRTLAEEGLEGAGLPWFHPGATWHMASRVGQRTWRSEDLAKLLGQPLATSP